MVSDGVSSRDRLRDKEIYYLLSKAIEMPPAIKLHRLAKPEIQAISHMGNICVAQPTAECPLPDKSAYEAGRNQPRSSA